MGHDPCVFVRKIPVLGVFLTVVYEVLQISERKSVREDKDEEMGNDKTYCPVCEASVEPTALYQCGNCGEEFNFDEYSTHRCPECGKFSTKILPYACPNCYSELEEELEEEQEEEPEE